MDRRNNRTNTLIMWLVTMCDVVLLNAVLLGFVTLMPKFSGWNWPNVRLFFLIYNIALLAGELKYHTRIHERYVSAGDIIRRVFFLIIIQMIIAYMLLRHTMFWTGSGWLVISIGVVLFVILLLERLIARIIVKRMRSLGKNSRTVTLVGTDTELRRIYEILLNDPTMGYRVQGYYADEQLEDARAPWLGTLKGLLEDIEQGKEIELGDELYVSLSRKERDVLRKLSTLCDSQVTRFYFVPVSVETIGLHLYREFINDTEIFTTHESPLQNPMNAAVKRAFDIVLSVIALVLTGVLLLPIVYLIIKIQSPGPLFFKQLRTGLDGKNFMCYKFRSMHVNKDADKLQATKDDPRKFPFGNLMRKTNIDEMPQFWNVLKGNMSIVGPRPHMLAHTEMYSNLISQYMVRHFVKPGVTGWAQVTGFRGETKELWQMEGRVKRDIWYIEHWSFWLDIRIIWLTFKSLFIHDKNAY